MRACQVPRTESGDGEGGIVLQSDFRPHSAEQAAILRAPEQAIDITCGRRFGKTSLIKAWLTGAWEGARWGAIWVPNGRFWYAAPTIKPACKDFYRQLKRSLAALTVAKNDTDLSLELFNGTLIECKSLESYDNLRGPGLDGLAIDEKGTVVEDAWTTVLEPMLADPPDRCVRRVLRAGSPRGKRHWTYREHMAGLEGPRGVGGRVAFQFPTWSRPGMQAYCDRKKRTTPTNVFRQEYGAEFLDNAAGYFLLVPEAHDGEPAPEKPDAAAKYAAGFDLAHSEDWSVLVVVRAKPRPWRVVAVERWARSDFATTRARVTSILRKWNADALCDATPGGFTGDVGVEAFRAGGWSRIDGFDARSNGGANREDLLANLAIAIEQGDLKLPGTYKAPAFPTLTVELEGFQVEMLPSGRARAGKGPNLNDDCVIALALAAWKAKHSSGAAASRQYY